MKPKLGVLNYKSDSVTTQKRAKPVHEILGYASFGLAILFCALFAITTVKAQSTPNSGYGVGNLHHGLVVGVIVGTAAVAGVGITYLVLHNRGLPWDV
jgi:hypothetical protein